VQASAKRALGASELGLGRASAPPSQALTLAMSLEPSSSSGNAGQAPAGSTASTAPNVDSICTVRTPYGVRVTDASIILSHIEQDRVTLENTLASRVANLVQLEDKSNGTDSDIASSSALALSEEQRRERERAARCVSRIKQTIPALVTFGFHQVFNADKFTASNNGSNVNPALAHAGQFHRSLFEAVILPKLAATLYRGRHGSAIVVGPAGCGKTQFLIRGPKGAIPQTLHHTFGLIQARNAELAKAGRESGRFSLTLSSLLLPATMPNSSDCTRPDIGDAEAIVDLMKGFVTDEEHRRRRKAQLNQARQQQEEKVQTTCTPIHELGVVIPLKDAAAESASFGLSPHMLSPAMAPSETQAPIASFTPLNPLEEEELSPNVSVIWRRWGKTENVTGNYYDAHEETDEDDPSSNLSHQDGTDTAAFEQMGQEEGVTVTMNNGKGSKPHRPLRPHVVFKGVTQVAVADTEESLEALRFAMHNAKQVYHNQSLKPRSSRTVFHMLTTITLTYTANRDGSGISKYNSQSSRTVASSWKSSTTDPFVTSISAKFHFVEVASSTELVMGAPSMQQGEGTKSGVEGSSATLSECLRSVAAVLKDPSKLWQLVPPNGNTFSKPSLLLRALADSLIHPTTIAPGAELLFPHQLDEPLRELSLSAREQIDLNDPDVNEQAPRSLQRPRRPTTATALRATSSQLSSPESARLQPRKQAWTDDALPEPTSGTAQLPLPDDQTDSFAQTGLSTTSDTSNSTPMPICVWITMLTTVSAALANACEHLGASQAQSGSHWFAKDSIVWSIQLAADQIFHTYQVLRLSAAVSGIAPRKRRPPPPPPLLAQTDAHVARATNVNCESMVSTIENVSEAKRTTTQSITTSDGKPGTAPEPSKPHPIPSVALSADPPQTVEVVPISPTESSEASIHDQDRQVDPASITVTALNPEPPAAPSVLTPQSGSPLMQPHRQSITSAVVGAQIRLKAGLFEFDDQSRGNVRGYALPTVLTRVCSFKHAGYSGSQTVQPNSNGFFVPPLHTVYHESALVLPLLWRCPRQTTTLGEVPNSQILDALTDAFWIIALPRFVQQPSPRSATPMRGLASLLDPQTIEALGLSCQPESATASGASKDNTDKTGSSSSPRTSAPSAKAEAAIQRGKANHEAKSHLPTDQAADSELHPFLPPSPKSKPRILPTIHANREITSSPESRQLSPKSHVSNNPALNAIEPGSKNQSHSPSASFLFPPSASNQSQSEPAASPRLAFDYYIVPLLSVFEDSKAFAAGNNPRSILINGEAPMPVKIPTPAFVKRPPNSPQPTPDSTPSLGPKLPSPSVHTNRHLLPLVAASYETGMPVLLRHLFESPGGSMRLEGYNILPGDIIQIGYSKVFTLLELPQSASCNVNLPAFYADSVECVSMLTPRLSGVVASKVLAKCEEWMRDEKDWMRPTIQLSVPMDAAFGKLSEAIARLKWQHGLPSAWLLDELPLPPQPSDSFNNGLLCPTEFTMRQFLIGTWYAFQHPYISSLLKRLSAEESKLRGSQPTNRGQTTPAASASKERSESPVSDQGDGDDLLEGSPQRKWQVKPFAPAMLRLLSMPWPGSSASGGSSMSTAAVNVLSASITRARWELVGLHEDQSEAEQSAEYKESVLHELATRAAKTNSELNALGLPFEFVPVLRPFSGWQIVQELRRKQLLDQLTRADVANKGSTMWSEVMGLDVDDDYWDKITDVDPWEEAVEHGAPSAETRSDPLDFKPVEETITKIASRSRASNSDFRGPPHGLTFQHDASQLLQNCGFGKVQSRPEQSQTLSQLRCTYEKYETEDETEDDARSGCNFGLTDTLSSQLWLRSIATQAGVPEADIPCSSIQCNARITIKTASGAESEDSPAWESSEDVTTRASGQRFKSDRLLGIVDDRVISRLMETIRGDRSDSRRDDSMLHVGTGIDTPKSPYPQQNPRKQRRRVTQASKHTTCLLDPSMSLWLGFEMRVLPKEARVQSAISPLSATTRFARLLLSISHRWAEYILNASQTFGRMTRADAVPAFYVYGNCSPVLSMPISVGSFLRRSLVVSRLWRLVVRYARPLLSRPIATSQSNLNSAEDIQPDDDETGVQVEHRSWPVFASSTRGSSMLTPDRSAAMIQGFPLSSMGYSTVVNNACNQFMAGMPPVSSPLLMLPPSPSRSRSHTAVLPLYVGSMALPLAPILVKLDDFDNCCNIFGPNGAVIGRARFELRARVLRAACMPKSERTRLRREIRTEQVAELNARLSQSFESKGVLEESTDSIAYYSEDEAAPTTPSPGTPASPNSIAAQKRASLLASLANYAPNVKPVQHITESIGEDLQLQLQLLRVEGLTAPPGYRPVAVMCLRRALPSTHEQQMLNSRRPRANSNDSNASSRTASEATGFPHTSNDGYNASMDEQEDAAYENNEALEVSRVASLVNEHWGRAGCARICSCMRLTSAEAQQEEEAALKILLTNAFERGCDKVMIGDTVPNPPPSASGSFKGGAPIISFESNPTTRRLIRRVPFGYVQSILDGCDEPLLDMYTQPAANQFMPRPAPSPRQSSDEDKTPRNVLITPTPFEFNIASPYIRVGFWFVPEDSCRTLVSILSPDCDTDEVTPPSDARVDWQTIRAWQRYAAHGVFDRNFSVTQQLANEAMIARLNTAAGTISHGSQR